MRHLVLLMLAACSAPALADVTSMTPGEMDARDEALADVKQAASAPAHPDDLEEEAAAMKEWQEATSPRSEHRRLAALAGTWDVEVTSWTEPDGDPAVALGSVTAKMVLGGRWLREEMRADMGGMPFEGIGFTGYDNLKGRFVATWMDNMSTSLSQGESLNVTADTVTFKMRGMDVMAGGPSELRTVLTVTDPAHHVFEMFTAGADGKEFRTLLARYSRSAAASPAPKP